tara:strand:+ start:68 stop:619 length:552 start_codon:yes stop_codon:yes gene_type:complete
MLNLIVTPFPESVGLNPILYERVCENIFKDDQTKPNLNGKKGAKITGFNLHELGIKEINYFLTWIRNILPIVSGRFSSKKEDETSFGFDVNGFKIEECWGIHYNGNESLIEHNHFPYILSFVYYVKTPKGSAPIMFGTDRYEVKEGECVFFLASQYHSVLPNESEGRCAIVGNISYVGEAEHR